MFAVPMMSVISWAILILVVYCPPAGTRKASVQSVHVVRNSKRGNATCYNCRANDTYVDGVRTAYGPITMGRFPPACDECPGWDNDIDVNGQTICNGKGTCNPMYDVMNEYTGMECKCQTDIETGSQWRGKFCECLATSIYSDTCQKCVQRVLFTSRFRCFSSSW